MIANEAIIQLETDFISSIMAFVKIALSLVMLSYAFIGKHLIIAKMISFGLGLFVMFILSLIIFIIYLISLAKTFNIKSSMWVKCIEIEIGKHTPHFTSTFNFCICS